MEDCRFTGFKFPIYLNERYADNATDAHNKVGTLIIEDNEFIDVSPDGYAAYIGRGAVVSASIKGNKVTGGSRGFQIFDCRGEIGADVPRTTGPVTIADNTFEGILQWPIDLMIGGYVSITGNNVIADLDAVPEVPVFVLRDTNLELVQVYTGNKVNGSVVELEKKDFVHESSPDRDLQLYYSVTSQ